MDFDAQWCGPPHNETTICGWFYTSHTNGDSGANGSQSKNHSSSPFQDPKTAIFGFQNKALVLQYAGNATIRQVPIVPSSRYHGTQKEKHLRHIPRHDPRIGEDFLYVLLEENTAMVWLCVYHWVYEKCRYSFRIGILTD